MVSLNPMEVVKNWGRLLDTPFGYLALAGLGVYIYLRWTGKLGQPRFFAKLTGSSEGGSGSGSGQSHVKQKPDYIIK